MRPEVEVIQQNLFAGERWDLDVLNSIVRCLKPDECELILNAERDKDSFNYLMKTIRKRHRDVVAGVTSIVNGEIRLTEKSSITEVIKTPEAYEDLKAKGIKRLCDLPHAPTYEEASSVLINKE